MEQAALSDFQREVARLFFSLRESDGYLLAGGVALVASQIVQAAQIDFGFDERVLGQMLMTLDRFGDDALPADPALVPAMRAFFAGWSAELAA